MKKILFVGFCLLFCFQLQAQKIKWLEGNWSGSGYQPNALNQEVWSMDLSYSSKDKKVSIDYPSLLCGGNWTLQKVEKNRAIFIESLSYGLDKCMNGCKLVVSYIDANFISVAFYDIGSNQYNVGAISLLKKRSTI